MNSITKQEFVAVALSLIRIFLCILVINLFAYPFYLIDNESTVL